MNKPELPPLDYENQIRLEFCLDLRQKLMDVLDDAILAHGTEDPAMLDMVAAAVTSWVCCLDSINPKMSAEIMRMVAMTKLDMLKP